jgi:hypothetical protein
MAKRAIKLRDLEARVGEEVGDQARRLALEARRAARVGFPGCARSNWP